MAIRQSGDPAIRRTQRVTGNTKLLFARLSRPWRDCHLASPGSGGRGGAERDGAELHEHLVAVPAENGFAVLDGPLGIQVPDILPNQDRRAHLRLQDLGLLATNNRGGHAQAEARPRSAQDALHRRDQRLIVNLVLGEGVADVVRKMADLIPRHLAIHQPLPLQESDGGSLGKGKALRHLPFGRNGPHVEELVGGPGASHPHLFLEAQENLGVLQARLGDKASPAAVSHDESFEHQAGKRLADGHAAGGELLRELGFRRDGVPRLEAPGQDLVPEELLEPEIDRDETVLGAHDSSVRSSAYVATCSRARRERVIFPRISGNEGTSGVRQRGSKSRERWRSDSSMLTGTAASRSPRMRPRAGRSRTPSPSATHRISPSSIRGSFRWTWAMTGATSASSAAGSSSPFA